MRRTSQSALIKFATLSFPLLATMSAATAFADPIPAGYTCSGSCGSLGASGVVSLSPTGNSQYLYVTTNGSSATAKLPTGAVGGETNGSTLATPVFTAVAGTALDFDFDFVTSDGAGYSDYAWAELFNSNGTPAELLFDARTEPSGSIVPGVGLPTPNATLDPSSVDIHAGTTWAPLGSYSGACWSAGCGNTGWVSSTYTIADGGTYYLEFGVTNEDDKMYDTGLAIDGVTVAGRSLTPAVPNTSAAPEPSSLAFMGTGLAGFAGLIRRLRA